MKLLIIFFIFSLSSSFAADGVVLNIVPKNPVAGEQFTAEFKLSTPHGEHSNISFNPIGVDVIDSQVAGTSTRTTYINDKLTVERTLTVVYRMIAKTQGSAFLNDIQIETNGKVTKLPSKMIRIVREPVQPKDIFAMAIPTKTDVFTGESIVVRYYLYFAVPVHDFKIEKYAKLDKFLKRFHQEPTVTERVSENGKVYSRRLVYSAQLFPNTEGQYKIDPMEFSVTYSTGRSNNPFGSFFSNRGQSRTKKISSKLIEINVKSIPASNIPNDFTGLVGKHDFNLVMSKSKFLTNEPIELKFEVKGSGALELYDSPKIVSSPNLEEFVSDADLNIQADFSATKTFNMTYIGRAAEKINPQELSFSYFDPNTQSFVSKKINFPGVEVVASNSAARQGNETNITNPNENNNQIPIAITEAQTKIDYFVPVYYFENTYLRFAKYINLILLLSILGFLIYKLYLFFEYRAINRTFTDIEYIKEKGVDYRRLYNIINLLGSGSDMKDIVQKSKLSEEGKRYFLDLINTCEKEYLNKAEEKRNKIKLKYLKEIIKVVS